MDDPKIGTLVEVREAAIGKLKASVAAFAGHAEDLCDCIADCDNAPITRDELTPLLRPAESAMQRVMHPLSLDIVIAGNLFHRLDERTAIHFLKVTYRALAEGGVLFFTADKETQVRRWCREADIGKRNVTMQRDAQGELRIEIQKLQ